MRAWWLCLALLAGCATVPPRGTSDIVPGYQPKIGTDESNIWYVTEKFEKELRQSPALISDPVLNGYVRDLTCKIAGELCADIRVYLLRSPYFNAYMAPNGTMVVFSGLLLRAENEADLAFVLAHEVGHFQAQHSLKNWRHTKNVANFTLGINLVTGGVVGLVGMVGAGANLAAFSRDQEREADDFGLLRISALGYAPARPGAFWDAIYEEDRVNPKGFFSAIFASHPATKERAQTLRNQAPSGSGVLRTEPYLAQIAAHRGRWLEDEVARRNYAQTELMLARIGQLPGNAVAVRLAEAEMFRKRNADGDLMRAVAAYQAVLDSPNVPPEAFRDLGLTLRKLARHAEAKAAFRRYLSLSPAASDHAMIEHYIDE